MSRTMVLKAGALAAAFVIVGAIAADARPGRGGNTGSRGERTYSAPPATNTAPSPANTQMNRTTAPAPTPGPMVAPAHAARPGAPAPAAAQTQRSAFGALGMGLAAGFLGAGLFGMLSGQGFLAGLSSFAGMLGFVLQVLLVIGIVWLVVRLVRGRREQHGPAPAFARGPMAGPGAPPAGPVPGMAGGTVAAPALQRADMVGIGPNDYAMFERRLLEVQEAYGRGDLASLRASATPEMVSYFADDLRTDEAKGVVQRISDVSLLQGDLAEAWREQGADYATVAMRYRLVDVTVERSTGRIVSGSPAGEEVVELWTFRRDHGGAWLLSAIQQA